MQWKNQQDRDGHYARAANDEWDLKTLEFVEELGNWMESDCQYRDFFPSRILNFDLHPDQIGTGLLVFVSEWAGDGEKFVQENLSGVECNLLAFYMQAQIEFAQQRAATESHKGEADESVGSPDE